MAQRRKVRKKGGKARGTERAGDWGGEINRRAQFIGERFALNYFTIAKYLLFCLSYKNSRFLATLSTLLPLCMAWEISVLLKKTSCQLVLMLQIPQQFMLLKCVAFQPTNKFMYFHPVFFFLVFATTCRWHDRKAAVLEFVQQLKTKSGDEVKRKVYSVKIILLF